jgi:N-methylhydantoinase A/oxoprolinase/acetone carboxylase beta subunit
VVAEDGTIRKVLSTPEDPALAVAAGLRAVAGAGALAHGTTVATNALLERRGGVVALITSPGQRDVIEIARQTRPSLYDFTALRPPPLVARHLRFEYEGTLPLLAGVDAIAISLLHADLDPGSEREIAARISTPVPVVLSSDVSPEFREYERTVTTVANAFLLKPCRSYLTKLAALAGEVLVLTSAGGLVPVAEACEHPVALLLSGPAGGVLAATRAAATAGFADCVTFDMGGTSTDVCLVTGGQAAPAAQREVAGLPIRVPALDVHTIGAGGGSLARLDPGGALVVGPESAGAVPGPACYGRGGEGATVTDADLVAGRLPLEGLPGLGRLDKKAAEQALERAGVRAEGVIAVVDEAMTQAVRTVSVQRGVDPAGLALVAFGGAGPLHACAIAEALGMPAVIVPPRAGVLSGVGILGAPRQVDLVRSWPVPAGHDAAANAAREMAEQAIRGHPKPDRVVVGLDCRYAGQSHELTVPEVAAFEAEHRRQSGYALEGAPVEVMAIRASVQWWAPVHAEALPPAPGRSGQVTGPQFVAEPDCTIWVAARWCANVDASGSWILRRVR